MPAPKGNQYALGNKGGRPPKYETVEEMESLIEDYFKSCEGELLTDKEGEPVLNKYNEPIYVKNKPPTVTGLALHLGFNSRQSLLNYQANEKFVGTITRAKAQIEEYAECRLYDKDGCNGAKFNLANNFGWKDKSEVDLNGDVTINVNIEE